MAQTAQKNAVEFLLNQHNDVRNLFKTIAENRGEERAEAFKHVVRMLAVHETAEEMVVYPALKAAGSDAKAIVDARLAEEDEAKKVLSELEKLDTDSSEFDGMFSKFQADVERHAAAEEQQVFPLLEREMDDDRLRQMTSGLEVAEGIAPTHPHKSAPESAIGNMLVGPFVSMVDRVRDAIRDAVG